MYQCAQYIPLMMNVKTTIDSIVVYTIVYSEVYRYSEDYYNSEYSTPHTGGEGVLYLYVKPVTWLGRENRRI